MKHIQLLIWVSLFCTLLLHADTFKVPYLAGPLVDEYGLLQRGQGAAVESMLNRLNQSDKIQMAILIPKSLQEMDIASYSIAVVENWKLGKKGMDNGLLFTIAPKERRMRLEVGYGLEGDITDAHSKQILDDHIAPYFRAGRFADGLMVGIEAVAGRLNIELSAPVTKIRKHPKRRAGFPIFFLVPLLFFYFFSTLFGGARRRGWGGGHRYYGGGGFGSFGRGGFGGGFSGGGGGFGGGGASSGW